MNPVATHQKDATCRALFPHSRIALAPRGRAFSRLRSSSVHEIRAAFILTFEDGMESHNTS